MPGPLLQIAACILSRQPAGADNFERLSVLCPQHGVLVCLLRRSKKSPASLDLFDDAELQLESANEGRTWFVREQHVLRRRDGIGRSYPALQTAAALGQLIIRHPLPHESLEQVCRLVGQSLDALASGARPDVVWLKALLLLLRDEGHPVREQWWPLLAAKEQSLLSQLLRQPVAGQEPPAEDIHAITQSLESWATTQTELRFDRIR